MGRRRRRSRPERTAVFNWADNRLNGFVCSGVDLDYCTETNERHVSLCCCSSSSSNSTGRHTNRHILDTLKTTAYHSLRPNPSLKGLLTFPAPIFRPNLLYTCHCTDVLSLYQPLHWSMGSRRKASASASATSSHWLCVLSRKEWRLPTHTKTTLQSSRSLHSASSVDHSTPLRNVLAHRRSNTYTQLK